MALGGVGARTALVAAVAPVEKDPVRQETAVVVPAPRPFIAATMRAADRAAAAHIVTDVLRRIRLPGIASHLQRASRPTMRVLLGRCHTAAEASRYPGSNQDHQDPTPFHGIFLLFPILPDCD